MPDTPLHQLSAARPERVDRLPLAHRSSRTATSQALVGEGVDGVTSNPTIFQAAIAEGDAYDEQLREVLKTETEPEGGLPRARRRRHPRRLRHPARPSGTRPARTPATAGSRSRSTRTSRTTPRRTIDEAKRLHALVDRPNLFIKIPATQGGPARDRGDDRRRHPGQRHADLLARAPPRGRRGLRPRPAAPRRRAAATSSTMASVASFFVSRVDTEADKRLDEIGGHDELKGTLAIANAKLAYQTYKEIFAGEQWEALRGQGRHGRSAACGRRPRPRTPTYRDVIYVEELIGPDTVNTMPRETVEAFQDHGKVERHARAGRRGRAPHARARSPRRASTTTTSSRRSSARAWRSSPSRFQQLFADVEAKRDALVAGMSDARPPPRARASSCAWTPSASSAAAGSGHPTSSMSAADLMAVLLDGHLRLDTEDLDDPANDHLIFSKGHASPLYYAVLKAAGIIDDAELLTFRKLDSRLEGHPTPRIPPTDVATGSLGQGLPIARRRRARRQAARPPALPRLVPVRRLRDGRGLDVGGVRARRLRRASTTSPRSSTSTGSARRARRWSAGTSTATSRRAEAFGWHAIAIDGHDVEAIEAAYAEAEATDRPPDRDRRPHEEGQGRQGRRGPARQARQAARRPRGGDRGARRRARPRPCTLAAPGGRHAAPVRRPPAASCRPGSSARRRPPARPTARRWPRSAALRGDVVALDGEVSNSTHSELFREAHEDRYFEMFIAEQQMVAAAVGMQVRGWVPFASTFAAFLSRAYDFVRMAAISRADIRLSRLARRRLDRRGRPVADGARGHRVVPRDPRLDGAAPVRRQPDGEARRRDGRPRGHLVHPHAARQDDGAHAGRTRTSGSAARASCATATTSRSSPAASPSTRRSRPPRRSRPTASRRA